MIQKNPHYKSLKNKGEPLILSDMDICDDIEENNNNLKVSKTQQERKIPENQIIQQFYENKPNKKYFAPKKTQNSQKANNSEPVDLKKKILIWKSIKSPPGKIKQKNKNEKFALEDSHNNSQKDVIIRRMKKKSENLKNSNVNNSVGHKKSSSQFIDDQVSKNNTNSLVISSKGSTLKKGEKMIRKEFRTHKYQNALDKFNEFKKEREMNRKNTPITKFRKGSAKRSMIYIIF